MRYPQVNEERSKATILNLVPDSLAIHNLLNSDMMSYYLYTDTEYILRRNCWKGKSGSLLHSSNWQLFWHTFI